MGNSKSKHSFTTEVDNFESITYKLSLPPEVWSIVIQNLHFCLRQEELTYLWTTVRQELQFDRLDNDRVIFKALEAGRLGNPGRIDMEFRILHALCGLGYLRHIQPIHQSATLQKLLNIGKIARDPRRLHDVEPGTHDCYKKGHPWALIRICGTVHDCDLPDAAVDVENYRISFNWKAMFSAFFAAKKTMVDRYGVQPDFDRSHKRAFTLLGTQNPQQQHDMLDRHQREASWREVYEWRTLVNGEAPGHGLRTRWAADSWLDLDAKGVAVIEAQQESFLKGGLRITNSSACEELTEDEDEDEVEVGDGPVRLGHPKTINHMVLIPPADGREVLLGRSNKPSHTHISSNAKVSRTHLRIKYLPILQRILIECRGRNRVQIHSCRNTKSLVKGETSTNGRAGAEILVEVGNVSLEVQCPTEGGPAEGLKVYGKPWGIPYLES
ncbi:MAG: hypothetical protein Q9217_006134 [Psora testacea]